MENKAVEADSGAKLEYHRRFWRESRSYTYVFRLFYPSGGVLAGENSLESSVAHLRPRR